MADKIKMLKWSLGGLGMIINLSSYYLSYQQFVLLNLAWQAWAVIGAILVFTALFMLVDGWRKENKKENLELRQKIVSIQKHPQHLLHFRP